MRIVGVDTGGTFTDFVLFDGNELRIYKIPSTPENPSLAICKGLKDLSATSGIILIHGTTVATNALLEGKVAKTVLVTNKGFEDVIEIGRQNRKELYNLHYRKGKVPVPRDMRIGLNCRIDYKGEIVKDIEKDELEYLKRWIKEKGAEAVAVCFLHSYANPEHEKRVGEALKELNIHVSLSHEILSEFREYERTITTVANACVKPIISEYFKDLKNCLGKDVSINVMHSNGGISQLEFTLKEPVKTVLSGPAGGVIGANYIGKLAGFKNLITFDMGGTSTDVSLIKDNRPSMTTDIKVGDFTMKVLSIDIHTVGAGGGSVAYFDEGGALRVGPKSVGADPGPACYGKGEKVAVTDANLYLSRLIPEFFLGGRMNIYPERSKEFIDKMAKEENMDPTELAWGITSVANTNMAKAVRVISVERGYDPADFILVSFGGAGGMHACYVAELMNIKKILIPRNPGLLSAIGLITTDFIRDYSTTVMLDADEIPIDHIDEMFKMLERKGIEDLMREGIEEKNILTERLLDMRYTGQSYELMVRWSGKKPRVDFEREYERLYGYKMEDRKVEIVNVRVRVIGTTEKPTFKEFEKRDTLKDAFLFRRKVFFGQEWIDTPVYNREKLNHGTYLEGPAIIVEYSSTTVVPPGYKLEVDKYNNLIIEVV